MLRQVSRLTGASSYRAQNASQLEKVFTHLPKDITVQAEHHELTALFAALAGLFALVAAAASMRWSPYP